ncbi:MAG: hypothetical protein JXA68_08990 [Ignavibacteriales bacterium]|nr:hypothetical protein [Ignavibacteriales bacterium]
MKKLFIIVISTVFLLTSCSIFDTIENIGRLTFKLNSIADFRVSDISISSKSSYSDFSPIEIIKLTSDIASGKLPIKFILNVDAKNPNDGTGGSPRSNITIESFPWKLFIDNKQTIAGNIGSPISVPGVGESTVIPLTLELDLFKFFSNNSLESLLNIALKLGGSQGKPTDLQLIADPVLGTPIGDLKYPNEITIVDFEWR